MTGEHPFDGQNLTYEARLKFWDDYSVKYSGFQQGDIPDRVVDRLFELGALKPDDCVLEVGSGPGTYSLKMAPRVRILTCMDTSPRMLDRLFASAEEAGYTNIERFEQDWNHYKPRKGYDVCIGTLCPGIGTPASVERMEGAARRSCVSVSWVCNHGDDLNAEIWQKLGRDYGYSWRSSTKFQDWLSDNGRDPTVEFFDTRVKADIPVEEMVAKETCAFASYGLEDKAKAAAEEILADRSDDGIIHYDEVNRMKLIVWDSR